MNALRLSRRFTKPIRWARIRTYVTERELLPLPPIEEWRDLFATGGKYTRDRVTLWNPQTATRFAHSFVERQSRASGEGKIIIEAFPGPGVLSRALLRMPETKIRKLIILEDNATYLKFLQPLEEVDSRVKVVPRSGFEWDTYSIIEEAGLLEDVETHGWDKLHPQLHFITHLEQVTRGEQFIAQLYRCIPDKSWLFKYGRVPMSIILNDLVWGRISAPVGKPARCKLTVIAEATATSTPAVDPEALEPRDEHFFPPVLTSRPTKEIAINIIPHAKQVIPLGMLDKWDYCLRRLFVLKSTPLKRAISSLAPGAQSLLKILTDPNLPPEQRVDINKTPRALTVAEWALLVRAFDNWPFAPEDLFISDAFVRHNSLSH